MADKAQKIIFMRRGLIIGIGQSFLFILLVARLGYLQIFQEHHYKTLSDKNRLQIQFVAPERGLILDRNGLVLVFNESYYRGMFNRSSYSNIKDSLEKISLLININKEEKKSLIEQGKSYGILPLVFKENLTWEEVAKLELYSPDIFGLVLEKSQWRRYLKGFSLSHILGYVGRVASGDLEKIDNLPPISGLRIGKTGLEKVFETSLFGKPGVRKIEVNAKRQVVRIVDERQAQQGQNLQITLDFELQKYVSDILSQHRSAAAVVLNPQTGAIYALVSHPDFDGNLFVKGISRSDWSNLIKDENTPLNNKAISGQYAPGSVFKMMVALAALSTGKISPQTTFHCKGHFDLGNNRFHCWNWRYGGHGHVNMVSAIAQSCDVFFYNAALVIGADPILLMAQVFGFGEFTGIDIPGEKKGNLPVFGPQGLLKKKVRREKGQILNISIGQGSVLSTLIQLVRMVSALGNGGNLITPHFVSSSYRDPIALGINPTHLSLVQQGMFQVVNSSYGTGHRAHFDDGFVLCGKTGSTQVHRLTVKQRQDGTYKNLPYEYRDHALFVGYGPENNPKLAVAIIIEHGVSGGRVAAPIAKLIIQKARERILGHKEVASLLGD